MGKVAGGGRGRDMAGCGGAGRSGVRAIAKELGIDLADKDIDVWGLVKAALTEYLMKKPGRTWGSGE